MQHTPPSAMARDLGVKFSDDLTALLSRSAAIMVPELGVVQSAGIVLSCLAMAGVDIEEATNIHPGSFVEVVKQAKKGSRLLTEPEPTAIRAGRHATRLRHFSGSNREKKLGCPNLYRESYQARV